MSSLAHNLHRLRKAKGWTQTKLAEEASRHAIDSKYKLTQKAITSLENGENKSTLSLPELAKALGVTPGDLDERYRADNSGLSGEQLDEFVRRMKALLGSFGTPPAAADSLVEQILEAARGRSPRQAPDLDTLAAALNGPDKKRASRPRPRRST